MCDCIEKFNKQLNETLNCDGKVSVSYLIDKHDDMIAFPDGMRFVFRRKKKNGEFESRQRSVPLVPTYCPFCGKPYKIKDDDERCT